jgi:hypothetical protein
VPICTRKPPLEKAVEYIEVLKGLMDEIDMPDSQRRIYWQRVFTKLADDFTLDTSIPPAVEIMQAIKAETS